MFGTEIWDWMFGILSFHLYEVKRENTLSIHDDENQFGLPLKTYHSNPRPEFLMIFRFTKKKAKAVLGMGLPFHTQLTVTIFDELGLLV